MSRRLERAGPFPQGAAAGRGTAYMLAAPAPRVVANQTENKESGL